MNKVKQVMNERKKNKGLHVAVAGLLLLLVQCWLPAVLMAQPGQNRYFRGDEAIYFQWRYGYSEFPPPEATAAAREDAARGKFGWYNGKLWSQAYTNWAGQTVQGVPLLFRGGSPYARAVKCMSETVPYEAAGSPVSFLLPLKYTIGSEASLAFAFRVKGASEETIACKFTPKAINSFTGGLCRLNFITLAVETPPTTKPLVTVTGLLHVVVYPPLVNYGGRTEFDFFSVTHHMDVESSLVIGSLYSNISDADPYQLAKAMQPDAEAISAAAKHHQEQLERWRRSTSQISENLLGRASVEVDCDGPGRLRDKGELRVTAYSGNPVKDFQYGAPDPQVRQMAKALTTALGRRFSLFRYQHHNLPWKMDDPSELDSSELPYLSQWLEVAGEFADTVVLDLQISPVIKLYKQYSRMGQLPLPAAGIPGAEWKKITRGYLTTLEYAKEVCPSLKIIQMPYELDNISSTAVHSDAHYHFFQCLYQAVAMFNAYRPKEDQLLVAGLGSNNPNSRWAFIDHFLDRYAKDTSSMKRLDYLTWHTYLFPGNYPAMVQGVTDTLQQLLQKHRIDEAIPVIVDEMGLAEPSTIEDLGDLGGAQQKEAAMAAYSVVLQDYYEKEGGSYIPISGAGWHFALLTYGKQNVLSAYAKGMLLRNRLGDVRVPVKTSPVDSRGFGLHAIATKEKRKISVLLFTASPSIFYEDAAPLQYADIDMVLHNLPAALRGKRLRVTERYVSGEDPVVRRILSADAYQTLPLTRGADRYEKEFSPQEVKELNDIGVEEKIVGWRTKSLHLPVGLDAYGMRLIEIEPAGDEPR